MTADTHIKAEISLVGFRHNPYAQNTLRAWIATRLAEPMIDGVDLFDFTRCTALELDVGSLSCDLVRLAG